MMLKWESLDPGFCFRAPAPVFGTIRVERYRDDGKWLVNYSVPGYSNTLIDGSWPTADEAKNAAQHHVSTACSDAPPTVAEALRCPEVQALVGVLDGLAKPDGLIELDKVRAALAPFTRE